MTCSDILKDYWERVWWIVESYPLDIRNSTWEILLGHIINSWGRLVYLGILPIRWLFYCSIKTWTRSFLYDDDEDDKLSCVICGQIEVKWRYWNLLNSLSSASDSLSHESVVERFKLIVWVCLSLLSFRHVAVLAHVCFSRLEQHSDPGH